MELQLADKNQSAKQHIDELIELRADVAKERSSLVTLKQAVEETAVKELEKIQKVEELHRKSLQDKVEILKNEKLNMKEELDRTKCHLQGEINMWLLCVSYNHTGTAFCVS